MFKNIELVIVFGLLSVMGCSNSDNNITQDKNKTVAKISNKHNFYDILSHPITRSVNVAINNKIGKT